MCLLVPVLSVKINQLSKCDIRGVSMIRTGEAASSVLLDEDCTLKSLADNSLNRALQMSGLITDRSYLCDGGICIIHRGH